MASEEKYRLLNSIHYRNTSIAVLVFSLADQKSFDDAKYYGDDFKSKCDGFPSIILVGNDLGEKKVISYEQGQKTAKELDAIYFEVSLKTGNNIDQLYNSIVMESIKYIQHKTRLFIYSIKLNFDYKALKDLKIENPCPYITFSINNDQNKEIQLINQDHNFEWNKTINFIVYNKKTDILKVNIFNKSSDDDTQFIDEIEIPVNKCTDLQFNKKIYIKKSLFWYKKIGNAAIYFDINSSLKNKPVSSEKISDEKQIKSTANVEFKILDTETIEKLLQKKQKIGSGATSNVYKVRNIFKSEGFLAIKILNDIFFELMKSTPTGNKEKKFVWDDDDNNFDDVIEEEEEREIPIEEVRKIFKEWEILSQLDHPNIIKTYGFYNGNRSHSPSIVLEYCKFNLKNAISHLENIDLVKVVYQICNAMQYLHDNKIIHRDLKVSNILINSQKNVKICDFGISKYIDVTTLTSMTHGIGTFIYMAPELFDPEFKLNEKIDVYAFGVVLYFIVTKGEIPKLLQNSILENYDIPINVNKLSKSIIKKCWSFQPKERPSFKSIMDTIVSNNFSLFDDINESISSLGF